MLKIDMQKAYDLVEWAFLEQVLNGLKCPELLVQWIMICLTTMSYSIAINGHTTKSFPAKRGLRQGEPISPFLFMLIMEYFTRSLKR